MTLIVIDVLLLVIDMLLTVIDMLLTVIDMLLNVIDMLLMYRLLLFTTCAAFWNQTCSWIPFPLPYWPSQSCSCSTMLSDSAISQYRSAPFLFRVSRAVVSDLHSIIFQSEKLRSSLMPCNKGRSGECWRTEEEKNAPPTQGCTYCVACWMLAHCLSPHLCRKSQW